MNTMDSTDADLPALYQRITDLKKRNPTQVEEIERLSSQFDALAASKNISVPNLLRDFPSSSVDSSFSNEERDDISGKARRSSLFSKGTRMFKPKAPRRASQPERTMDLRQFLDEQFSKRDELERQCQEYQAQVEALQNERESLRTKFEDQASSTRLAEFQQEMDGLQIQASASSSSSSSTLHELAESQTVKIQTILSVCEKQKKTIDDLRQLIKKKRLSLQEQQSKLKEARREIAALKQSRRSLQLSLQGGKQCPPPLLEADTLELLEKFQSRDEEDSDEIEASESTKRSSLSKTTDERDAQATITKLRQQLADQKQEMQKKIAEVKSSAEKRESAAARTIAGLRQKLRKQEEETERALESVERTKDELDLMLLHSSSKSYDADDKLPSKSDCFESNTHNQPSSLVETLKVENAELRGQIKAAQDKEREAAALKKLNDKLVGELESARKAEQAAKETKKDCEGSILAIAASLELLQASLDNTMDEHKNLSDVNEKLTRELENARATVQVQSSEIQCLQATKDLLEQKLRLVQNNPSDSEESRKDNHKEVESLLASNTELSNELTAAKEALADSEAKCQSLSHKLKEATDATKVVEESRRNSVVSMDSLQESFNQEKIQLAHELKIERARSKEFELELACLNDLYTKHCPSNADADEDQPLCKKDGSRNGSFKASKLARVLEKQRSKLKALEKENFRLFHEVGETKISLSLLEKKKSQYEDTIASKESQINLLKDEMKKRYFQIESLKEDNELLIRQFAAASRAMEKSFQVQESERQSSRRDSDAIFAELTAAHSAKEKSERAHATEVKILKDTIEIHQAEIERLKAQNDQLPSLETATKGSDESETTKKYTSAVDKEQDEITCEDVCALRKYAETLKAEISTLEETLNKQNRTMAALQSETKDVEKHQKQDLGAALRHQEELRRALTSAQRDFAKSEQIRRASEEAAAEALRQENLSLTQTVDALRSENQKLSTELDAVVLKQDMLLEGTKFAKARCKDLQATLASEKTAKEEVTANLKKEIRILTSSHESLAKEKHELQVLCESQNIELETLKMRLLRLTEELKAAQAGEATLSKERFDTMTELLMAAKQDAVKLKSTLDKQKAFQRQKQAEMQSLEEANDRLRADLQAAREETSKLREQLAKLKIDRENDESGLESFITRLATLSQRHFEDSAEIRQLRETLQTQTAAIAAYETTKKVLEERIAFLQEERDSLSDRLEQRTPTLPSTTSATDIVNENRRALESLSQSIADLCGSPISQLYQDARETMTPYTQKSREDVADDDLDARPAIASMFSIGTGRLTFGIKQDDAEDEDAKEASVEIDEMDEDFPSDPLVSNIVDVVRFPRGAISPIVNYAESEQSSAMTSPASVGKSASLATGRIMDDNVPVLPDIF